MSLYCFLPLVNKFSTTIQLSIGSFYHVYLQLGKGMYQENSRRHWLLVRVDGSVDRQQIDNKHVCAHIVTAQGNVIQRFLGFSEPNEHGVIGYLQSVKDASQSIL